MAMPDLDVWMNGEHVGLWHWARTGTPLLQYEASWLASPNSRPLSLSLPIPTTGGEIRGAVVENYFDNLLPDSTRIRERIRRRMQAASTRAADLLLAVGRDCVGAVQLVPRGEEPPPVDRIESEPLSDAQVAQVLQEASSDRPNDDDLTRELRISLAGAQEKTALLRAGDRWHLPHGATPTTHIFKLPLGLIANMRVDMSESVENEWLCSRLLAALGFDVAPAAMGEFEGTKALIVERFDRRPVSAGQWIARLPQEDFCQVKGLPSELKYESDGGPGMRAIFEVLSGGKAAHDDRRRFALAQLAFWLLAGIDGHAKNFSIFLERDGYRLTPLYDVLSAWPVIGNGRDRFAPRRVKLAMAVRSKNAHYNLHEIQTRHWQAVAAQSGVPDTFDHMVALVRAVPEALARVEAELPQGFPKTKVWLPIRRGVLAQAKLFAAGLSSP